jgi:hypothetical protein
VGSSPPAAEEIGAMDREIEYRQGRGKKFRKNEDFFCEKGGRDVSTFSANVTFQFSSLRLNFLVNGFLSGSVIGSGVDLILLQFARPSENKMDIFLSVTYA